MAVGSVVGFSVGTSVGADVGSDDDVGVSVGVNVGSDDDVGAAVGANVGSADDVGTAVGVNVGSDDDVGAAGDAGIPVVLSYDGCSSLDEVEVSGFASTFTLHLYFFFPSLAVITAFPCFFAFILPFFETVATLFFDELHFGFFVVPFNFTVLD